MATQLKLRQGNKKANSLYIGALGELTYDTEQRELHVHDGTNPGGNVCLKKSSTDLDTKQDLDSSININNITNISLSDSSITFQNGDVCYIGPKYKNKFLEVINYESIS